MRPYIPTGVRTAVVKAAGAGRDPFALRGMDEERALRAMVAGLVDPTDEGRSLMADELTARHPVHLTGLDLLTAELVIGTGLSPLSLAWMAHVRGFRAEILDEDGHDVRVSLDDDAEFASADCMTFVEIAPRVQWYVSGTLFMPEPPATIANAAIGMRLSDLVRHPALDRRDLRIVDLSEEARIGDIGLVTDVAPEPIGVEALLALPRVSAECRRPSCAG